MNVRYRVELSQTERAELTALLSGGKHAARKLKRAQILLAVDAGASDDDIATSVGVGGSTVYRTKQRFVLGNLEAALSEEPRPGAGRKLSGKEEALLVATACSKPPHGRARWTLELLAGEIVRLTEHDSVSRETVRRRLAENELKPWLKECWCLPSAPSGEFVWAHGTFWTSTPDPTIHSVRKCVWMRPASNWWPKRAHPFQPHRGDQPASITNTSGVAYVPCSCCASRWPAGARCRSRITAAWWTSPT